MIGERTSRQGSISCACQGSGSGGLDYDPRRDTALPMAHQRVMGPKTRFIRRDGLLVITRRQPGALPGVRTEIPQAGTDDILIEGRSPVLRRLGGPEPPTTSASQGQD